MMTRIITSIVSILHLNVVYTTSITTYTHHYGLYSSNSTNGKKELAILHGNRSAASTMLGAYDVAAHDS